MMPNNSLSAHAIAIPFDIVTIIVYASVPSLRNVHGISLICLQVSIITCNIVLMSAYTVDYNDYKTCNVISFISYWAYMAKELWMFTIGFDLWQTLW